MREPDYLGNCDLLKKSIIGFFSSRTTAPLSVIPTLDWAHEVARKSDVAVMSGFQSPMEREVLDILLGGKCGIIVALNRSIYRKVPSRYADAFANDRLLFVSLIPGDVVIPSPPKLPSETNTSPRPQPLSFSHQSQKAARFIPSFRNIPLNPRTSYNLWQTN